MSIYLKTGQIPFPLPYGHRISILSDGHAYYEDMVNPCVDLGEVISVSSHGRLVDGDELFKEFERKAWYDNADRDIAEDILLDAPTVIPTEKETTE